MIKNLPGRLHVLSRIICASVCLLFFSVNLHGQAHTVSGTVSDPNGLPVAGAGVIIKGTTTGVSTLGDGTYSLTVPSPAAVLQFSMLGYTTVEETVGTRTTINVVFQEESTALDEVVVVGFQTQKKVNVTGSIASVNSEMLENRPVTNIGQALQGVVPGINIGISNGGPNTVPSFNIRGGTSMYSDTNDSGKWKVSTGEPLILIDNVQADAQRLNQLNPNDIDNISFLKDASSAAIYGVRAAFGVMIVTTKSGKYNEKAKVNYSYDISLDTPYFVPDILDAYTILQAQEERSLWTGGSGDSGRRERMEKLQERKADPSLPNYYMNDNSLIWIDDINPFKTAVRNWTPTQKHNLSAAGGTEQVNYYISGGLMNQEGMYKINTDEFKRYNALVSLNAKITKWFNMGAKATYSSTVYDAPYMAGHKGNLWSVMMGNEYYKNILTPIRTGPDDPIPNNGTDNVLAYLTTGANTHTVYNTFMIAATPEIIILPELKLKTEFTYMKYNYEMHRKIPYYEFIYDSWTLTPSSGDGNDNTVRLERNTKQNYTLNVYADYNKSFGKHTISGLLGFNQEENKRSDLNNTYKGLWSVDVPKPLSSNDPNAHTQGYLVEEDARRSGFGRINYNYGERYIFEINARYDGSSRFTKKDRYQFFPTYAAAWRISEEAFMKDISWINQLKLRTSWGKLGNDGTKVYGYQAVYDTSNPYYVMNGVEIPGLGAGEVVSSSLTWEKARTVDVGIEGMVLNNRLNFEFSWYDRLTTDILTAGSRIIPAQGGFKPPYDNSGSVRSRGWELSLGWRDRLTNGFRYNVGFTLSDYMSTVVKYDTNAETRSLDYIYPGQKVGQIWGYTFGGILQEIDLLWDEENNRYHFYGPYQQVGYSGIVWPGYIWYKDINGDGKVDSGANTADDPGDRKIIGNSTPRFRFGLNLSAEWKGFDLSMVITGVGKKDLWISNSAFWGGDNAGNQWMYDRSWRPDRTNAKYPMYGSTKQVNNYYLTDASYIKLKQVVLGYTLPQHITQKFKVDKLRINVSGFNLFSITGVPKPYDPEQISDNYPMKRTVSFGVQVGF